MSSNISSLAKDLHKIFTESDRKTKGYDTSATVLKVGTGEEDDTIWVKIPGGIDATPVRKTINAKEGDIVQVTVSGGSAWLVGNASSPPTDDAKAEEALAAVNTLDVRVKAADNRLTVVEGGITVLENRVETAEGDITAIEGDISDLGSRVETAEGSITTIEGDISDLDSRVDAAEGDITTIEGDISGLTTRIGDAESDLSTAEAAITTLQTDVANAQDDIDDALVGLALAENVIGTLAWLTAHSTVTTDTTPTSGKSYYIRHQDGTFELVEDTTGKNPAQEGWYEMDSAISNYVGAHLSLTDYGLNLVLDNSSYRIHIGTLTSDGDDGVYLLDPNGNVVSFFGENINFSSTRPQYIGNNNAYIRFDPSNGGSISIGGANITLGDTRTLDEVVATVDNTFIFDVTYKITGSDPNKIATLTAHVYRGGVDITSQFYANQFLWSLKTEDGETPIIPAGHIDNTGYTTTVNLSDCGYGAEVICKFSTSEDSPLLTNDDDNLTDVNNTPLTGRTESGNSVRVRDLTVSTTILPTDKLLIVGGEDEHLATISTIADVIWEKYGITIEDEPLLQGNNVYENLGLGRITNSEIEALQL